MEHSPRVSSEWGVELLDVDAYLTRLGFAEPPDPTLASLNALHRAHATTVPFENLDVLLGRGVPLDIESLQHKLVRNRRGGYCFEHNLLFAALLERLGFQVTRLAARVRMGTTRILPRTHMVLRVDIDGQATCVEEDDWVWLADVGFGGEGLLEPIPLRHGATARQDSWHYLLTRETAERWVLHSGHSDGWLSLYSFTLEPQHHVDYVVANHYTSTHPHSPFVTRAVVQRVVPHQRARLVGRELTEITPDGTGNRREVPDDELGSALKELGIELADEDLRQLRTMQR